MKIWLWIVRSVKAGLCFMAFLSLQFGTDFFPKIKMPFLGVNFSTLVITGIIAFTISLITKQI